MSNIPIYNDCKNGSKIPVISIRLEKILKPTYGIIIYQGFMQIAQTLADLQLKRYFKKSHGKKKKAELDEQKENLFWTIKMELAKRLQILYLPRLNRSLNMDLIKVICAYALIAANILKTYFKEDFILPRCTN